VPAKRPGLTADKLARARIGPGIARGGKGGIAAARRRPLPNTHTDAAGSGISGKNWHLCHFPHLPGTLL